MKPRLERLRETRRDLLAKVDRLEYPKRQYPDWVQVARPHKHARSWCKPEDLDRWKTLAEELQRVERVLQAEEAEAAKPRQLVLPGVR